MRYEVILQNIKRMEDAVKLLWIIFVGIFPAFFLARGGRLYSEKSYEKNS